MTAGLKRVNMQKLQKLWKPKKKGFISIVSVLLCLGAIVILMGIITTYEHQLIIRNLEAVADLAAVESVREVIDENSLRNEVLEVKADKMDKMRENFLRRIRDNIPTKTFEIIRIEIPTINGDGYVAFTGTDLEEMTFPNSKDAPFVGPTTVVDSETGISRTSYFVGGGSTDRCAMELARISGNLAVSGSKKKDAYILSSKVTIFFKTTSSLNNLSYSLLNYVNILSGNERAVVTKQIDKETIAVTIQTIGQVVLR